MTLESFLVVVRDGRTQHLHNTGIIGETMGLACLDQKGKIFRRVSFTSQLSAPEDRTLQCIHGCQRSR